MPRLVRMLIIGVFSLCSGCGLGIDPFPNSPLSIARVRTGFHLRHEFQDMTSGQSPGGILFASNGYLYGVTSTGGLNSGGVLYRTLPAGGPTEVMHHFDFPSGSGPIGAPIEWNGSLYGVAINGGSQNTGVLYRFGLDGSGYQVMAEFDSNNVFAPVVPISSLLESGGKLYGVAAGGGASGFGAVYFHTPGSGLIETARSFATEVFPSGNLISIGSEICGTTEMGGTAGYGHLYCFETGDPGVETVTLEFTSSEGSNPAALLGVNGAIYGITRQGGNTSNGVIFTSGPGFGKIEVLHHFQTNSFESGIHSGLTHHDGHLYGTTYYGGDSDFGTLYRIQVDGGNFTVLHSFGPTSGKYPSSRPVFYSGSIWGDASSGGGPDHGTLFHWRLY